MSTPLDSNECPTVLICEAYDSLREGLSLVLGGRYQVVSVPRATELPNLLEKTTPSLLLVAVDNQPQLYDVLVPISQATPELPILLLFRSFSLEQQTEALRLLGHVSFMAKPFSVDHLLEKVQTLIQGYSSSPIRRHIVRIAS